MMGYPNWRGGDFGKSQAWFANLGKDLGKSEKFTEISVFPLKEFKGWGGKFGLRS